MKLELMNLVKKQINEILSIVNLLSDNKAVIPAAIKIKKIKTKEKTYFKYKNASHYKVQGPSIYIISKILSWLVYNFDFYDEADNKIKIDGFMIKDATIWKSIVPQYLFGISSYSGFCNCKCEFCYEVEGLLPWEKSIVSIDEVKTRIKLYDKKRERGFPAALSYYLEPFFNKSLLKILKIIRDNTDETITLSTNGSYLSEDVVQELAKLKPIILQVSLNTISKENRRILMKDSNPEIAIKSLSLLYKYKIQYSVSVVAWPKISTDELEETVRFIDRFTPFEIIIHLPGYTKYKQNPFLDSHENHWDAIIEIGQELRKKLKSPIKILPSTYYQNKLEAIVDGVYLGSPAEAAGIEIGDQIIRVDGIPVTTRSAANRLFERRSSNCLTIDILRNGNILKKLIKLDLDDEKDLYPFKPIGYKTLSHSTGIYINEDFSLEYLVQIQNKILQFNSNHVLIVSSKLIYPILKKVIDTYEFTFLCEICNIQIVRNDFFGGNICLGDLAIVSDFIETIREYTQKFGVPDIIFIPSSFIVDNGFDIVGESYLEIERVFDTRVEIIDCFQIFD